MVGRTLLAAYFACQLLAVPSFAQPNVKGTERIGRDRPLLVPKSLAPRARMNDLKFVQQGGTTWLLAAASDKVVHRWVVEADGSLTPAPPLRWPIFRGLRGNMYALADLGDGRVAIGGVGAKTSQVSLVSIEGDRPPVRLVDLGTAARQNVWSLAADNATGRLYVGEAAQTDGVGLILCWNYRRNPPTLSRARSGLEEVKQLAVSPNGTYVAAAGPSTDGTSWTVRVFEAKTLAANPAPVPEDPIDLRAVPTPQPVQEGKLDTRWPDAIGGVDWITDSTWVAASVMGYSRGTVGGRVDLPGFGPDVAYRSSEAFATKISNPEGVEVFNANLFPSTWLDETSGNSVTIQPGRSQVFGKSAKLWRTYENRERFGPFNGFVGHRITVPTYVRGVDFCPRTSQLASVVEEDRRYHVLLDTRKDDGTFRNRVALGEGTKWREVTGLATSADGHFVAAAGSDLCDIDGKQVCTYQVRVWSAVNGRLLAKFPDESKPIPAGGPIIGIVTQQQGNRNKRDTIIYQTGIPGHFAESYYRVWPGIVGPQDDVTAKEADDAFAAKGKSRSLRFAGGDKAPTNGTLDVATGAFTAGSGGRGVPIVRTFFNDAEGRTIGPVYTQPHNGITNAIKFVSGGRWYLAVAQMDGIQIWDWEKCLDPRQGYHAIVRAFYGHDAQITSIDVATDGNQLFSASTDGTICGWNLRDLDRTRELGLTFDRTGTVTAVTDDSAGWYGGFQVGMRVTDLQVAGVAVPRASLANRLAQPLPGLEHFFTTDKDVNLLTPVAHDPLWTYYPRFDKEAVMWTPEGYFETSELKGTGSIEWVVNLAGVFGENDELVVMAGLDHEGFRDANVIDDVFKDTTRAKTTIPPPPVIALKNEGGTWNLNATPTGAGRVTKVEFVLNGRVVRSDTRGFSVQQSDLNALLRNGRNSVAAVVETGSEGKTFPFRRIISFDATPPPRDRTPRVNFLGIAVEQAPKMPKLETVVSDVTDVHDALRDNAARLPGRNGAPSFQLLTGIGGADEPTKENIQSAFDDLTGSSQPDDLTVIVLSSHGELNKQGEYVFHATDGTIPQVELSDLIERLPCRTLLILDTCHAGAGAGKQEHVAQFARVVNGPMVLTACKPEESAYFEKVNLGHGYFLAAVREALVDKPYPNAAPFSKRPDANGDGSLSVDELARFVQQRTRDHLDKFGPSSEEQTPQVVPSIFFTDSNLVPVRSR